MSQSKGFDMSKMSTAGKILVIASGLYVIDTFLQWNRVCIDLGIDIAGVNNCAGVAGTHGLGSINLILALALVAWEVMWVMDVKIGTTPRALVSAGLAGALVILTILKIVIDNEFLYIFAWIGLILAIVIGYGGFLRWKEYQAEGTGSGGAMPPPPSDGMSA